MTGLIVFDLYEPWRAKLAVVPSQYGLESYCEH